MKKSVRKSLTISVVKEGALFFVSLLLFASFLFMFFHYERTESLAQCFYSHCNDCNPSTETCCSCGLNHMSCPWDPDRGVYSCRWSNCERVYGKCGCYGFGDPHGSCYRVTYNPDGGHCTMYDSIGQYYWTVQSKDTVGPGKCTRSGYVVDRFVRESGCGTLNSTTGTISNVTCDTKIKVIWEPACKPETRCSILSPGDYTLNSCPSGSTCQSKNFDDKCGNDVTCYRPNCGSLSVTEPARYICNSASCGITGWSTQSQPFTYANNGGRTCYRPNCSSLDTTYISNSCSGEICYGSFCFVPECTSTNKSYSYLTYSSSRTCYCNELNAYPLEEPSRITLRINEDYNILPDSQQEASNNSLPLLCQTGDPLVQMYIPLVTIPGAKDTVYHYSGTLGTHNSLHPFNRININSFASNLIEEGSEGALTGGFSTLNHCDDNRRYSPTITGYYKVEKNEKVSPPEEIYMSVDGVEYTLEKENSSNPTKIKRPSKNSNDVYTRLNTFQVPDTAHSSKYGYRFEVNNKGIIGDSQYADWSNFACTRPEDYCKDEYQKPLQNFVPTSLPLEGVLLQGAQGEVSGNYFTCNRCGCPGDGAANARREDSDSITGYYLVNRNPILESLIFDADPEGEKDCFADPNHTGTVSANKIDVTMIGIDEDNNDEIEGAILYFVKENRYSSLEENKRFVTNYDGTDKDVVGIMLRRNGSDWQADPRLYLARQDGNWAYIGNLTNVRYIEDSNGERIVTISSVDIQKDEIDAKERVTFKFTLEFHYPLGGDYLNDKYQVRGLVFDEYMTFKRDDENFERIDQTHGLVHSFNWTFDFNPPEMGNLSHSVFPPKRLQLDLSKIENENTGLLDRDTGIKYVVLDAYREGAYTASDIILELPDYPGIPKEITPSSQGTNVPIADIGRVGVNHGWTFEIQEWPPTVQINIGDNEEGTIIFYSTAFDRSCNYVMSSENLDLRSWIATKGGVMYSGTNFGPTAKDFSELSEQAKENVRQSYIINNDTTLRTHNLDEIINRMTTGTDILMSRSDFLNSITHGAAVGAVRAIRMQNDNDTKGYWFSFFKANLEKQRELLGDELMFVNYADNVLEDLSVCSDSDTCAIYSTSDLILRKPEGQDAFVCNKRTLIMSEGNITIDPNVETIEDEFVGCIFISNADIVIREGDYQSLPPINPDNINDSGKVGYDYIAGFLIAENQVRIEESDIDLLVKDGLEIKGSMVGFGSNPSNGQRGILNNRTLRLHNHTNPVVVMSWDVRYGKMSEYFFGRVVNLYKQEVGFKVY